MICRVSLSVSVHVLFNTMLNNYHVKLSAGDHNDNKTNKIFAKTF